MKFNQFLGSTAIAVTCLMGPAVHAAEPAVPVQLIKTIPLPDVTDGDFDHFAVDLKRNRLYVSVEKHHSIEVFNLKTGEHLASGGPVTTPHTLALNVEKNELFVADGGENSVKVLDGADLHLIKRIDLKAVPDAGVYDPKTGYFYVGNSLGEKADYSMITAISTRDATVKGEIRVEANNVESMEIDQATRRMFVNLRDKSTVGVIDLNKDTVARIWSVPDLKLNTPMAFDAKDHRLFIAGRKPGKLFVLNSDTGATIATYDCADIGDDMTYDARTKRIYVSAAEGLMAYQQDDADHYHEIARVDTHGGKTSVLVPSLDQLYVPHTRTSAPDAGLEIYKVQG
ncbi:DNA-binding beta-propeller fold protein YncE [Paraburkholderia sp. WC7.3g]|uniref:YncE family protein n=1 Tax=Paraburkholderia sp. WC7.3g TaxID=2991070 RepID=UPI003D1D857A